MKSSVPYRCIAGVTAAAAVLWAASYLTLQKLGTIISTFDETLGTIFGSLQTAVISPSALFLFVTGALFLLLYLLCGRRRWVFALSPLFAVFGYLGAAVFATVNGVLVWDMARIIADLAANGLFDLL